MPNAFGFSGCSHGTCVLPPSTGGGQVCRDTRRAVTDYSSLAFQVKYALEPFMDHKDVVLFREVLRDTGAVISGAVALHFFNRVTVQDTPLEIYVERTHTMEVALFFQYIGYQYRPRERQEAILADAHSLAINRFNLRNAAISELYSILDMFTLVRGDTEVKIMMVVDSALDAILDFHSSPVMNFITHRSAYSLFPYNTFIKKSGLLFVEDNGHVDGYRRRGWRMYRRLSNSRYETVGKEITVGTRYVGDQHTWTIDLDDLAPQDLDPTLFNSFELQWSRRVDAYIIPQIARLVFLAPQYWTQSRIFASSDLIHRFTVALHSIQPVAHRQTDDDVVRTVLSSGEDTLFKFHPPCATDTIMLVPWKATLRMYWVPVVKIRSARLYPPEGMEDPFAPDEARRTPEPNAVPSPDLERANQHLDDHIDHQIGNGDAQTAISALHAAPAPIPSNSANPLIGVTEELQLMS
ncbi:hypothetical protein EV122DRAFT_284695 [Schizophyllum commune]